jgi:hypothetical protein
MRTVTWAIGYSSPGLSGLWVSRNAEGGAQFYNNRVESRSHLGTDRIIAGRSRRVRHAGDSVKRGPQSLDRRGRVVVGFGHRNSSRLADDVEIA